MPGPKALEEKTGPWEIACTAKLGIQPRRCFLYFLSQEKWQRKYTPLFHDLWILTESPLWPNYFHWKRNPDLCWRSFGSNNFYLNGNFILAVTRNLFLEKALTKFHLWVGKEVQDWDLFTAIRGDFLFTFLEGSLLYLQPVPLSCVGVWFEILSISSLMVPNSSMFFDENSTFYDIREWKEDLQLWEQLPCFSLRAWVLLCDVFQLSEFSHSGCECQYSAESKAYFLAKTALRIRPNWPVLLSKIYLNSPIFWGFFRLIKGTLWVSV